MRRQLNNPQSLCLIAALLDKDFYAGDNDNLRSGNESFTEGFTTRSLGHWLKGK
jgi:hypothetical protein